MDERAMCEGILEAYRQGAFPMADPPGRATTRASESTPDIRRIRWYSPDPRAVLPLEEPAFHVPRRLERRLRSEPFKVTTDAAFEQVIRACAVPSRARGGRAGSWIDEQIVTAYCMLHRNGHAHSIEAWLPASGPDPGLSRHLMGGLYGVSIGAAFFAESMFCRPDLGGANASNICLVHLVRHLRSCDYQLLDAQIANAHTRRFGLVELPRDVFLERLGSAVAEVNRWKPLIHTIDGC
jgi:leucyl/phenylalanyl-tRNA--protein transferase